MDSFVVRVVDSIIQVETNPTVQPEVQRAEAAVTNANTAAASAAANAAKLSPFITLPASSSALNRLVRIEIYKYIGIVALTVPARIGVRDFARDAVSGGRFRLRLASFDGVSTYVEVAKESTSAFIAPTGFVGEVSFPIYASTTAFGVPVNTIIGVAYVDFTDGSTFGTYAANNITWAAGGLIRHRLTPSAAFDASVTGVVVTNDSVSYTARSTAPFVTLPTSSTSTTGRGALACTRITIDPAFPLGSANVLLWECGRRSADSFFRAQIATFDGVSTSTLLAATNNNNAINATGLTGLVVYPLTAQASNTLGIPAGTVIGEIEKLAPESDAVFEAETVSDRSVRFLAGEIIREKLFRLLGDELPYEATVLIDSFQETASRSDASRPHAEISASIVVSKPSQKAVVIGERGERIKRIGSEARRDIARLIDGSVHLELWVKVKGGWADDAAAIRAFGYGS
jgi:hypothetical protein